MTDSIDLEAERLIREYAGRLATIQPRECLACYLDRVLRDTGCDGSLRLARAYRDAVAPRATALERRLGDHGGFCDCEVLMNVYWARSDRVVPCLGVRRGSTQPCELWEPPSRYRWQSFDEGPAFDDEGPAFDDEGPAFDDEPIFGGDDEPIFGAEDERHFGRDAGPDLPPGLGPFWGRPLSDE
jgi:hypothetical protein